MFFYFTLALLFIALAAAVVWVAALTLVSAVIILMLLLGFLMLPSVMAGFAIGWREQRDVDDDCGCQQ